MSLLQQRRNEAAFIKPFLAALVGELGEERAQALVRGVVEGVAREQGRRSRADGSTDLAALTAAWEGFAASGALHLEWMERSNRRLHFRVTECRYAEMYRELGLERWGAVLSCGRDGPFAEGLCPGVTLDRSRTLIEGNLFCEFVYTKV